MQLSAKLLGHALPPLCVLLLSVAPVSSAESIHPDSVFPATRPSDAPNWELGTVFRTTQAGKITQARVFSLAEESGEHQVRIWRNADNTLLAGPIAWTFGGEDTWITLDIPDVAIQANEAYTISISTTADGWYPANGGYFAAAGRAGSFLTYPESAGVFNETAGARPTNSFNSASYLRDLVFEADLSGTVMRVQSGSAPIEDDAAEATSANGTDIGGVGVNAGTREQFYTILNLGQTSLELTGNPRVAITGTNAQDFVVVTQPGASVAAGGSTTFTVRFDPSGIGVRKAHLTIPHADAPNNAYDFAIQGSGLGGGAGILGNDSDGTFARNIDDTQIHGNRFQAPSALRITELHARVLELQGIFKCAVYSDTNGVADHLLRSSLDVVNATNGWNTFTLASPLDLVAGDYYWLVIWADTVGARIQADPVGGAYQGAYSFAELGGVWPDPISLPNLVTAEPRTYCIYAEGTPIGIASGPELDLRGAGKLIVAGDSTPSTLDGTDFGSIGVAAGNVDRSFTLENRGDAAVELKGTPVVAVTGPQAADFVISAAPGTPIAPGATNAFTVRFHPLGAGLRSAVISIASNDADESPYEFAVQGAGVNTGEETLWPDTKTGRDVNFDGTYYELGTVFRPTIAGKITHLRVYSLASETGDHTARVWRNDDETIIGGPYTWTYGGTTGWITLDIPDLDVAADTDYTVSVSTGTSAKRNYPNLAADLTAPGSNGQHLTYPINAGVFTTTAEGRPTESFNGGNYLRDIVFLPAGVSSPLRIVELKPETGTGRLTLRWEGGSGQFQVEKAAVVTGPFQAAGAPQTAREFTDPTAPNNVNVFYRVRQLAAQ